MKNSTQTKFNAARVPKRHENDLSHVKHIVRKAAALFVFAMFVACAATPAMAAGLMKITEIQGGGGASKSDTDKTAQYPDRTIYFGNYWQTLKEGIPVPSTTSGDYNYEGIKWRVLANDQTGKGTKRVLLLSDQGLYADAFNTDSSNGNMWVSSDIRATLTGLDKQEVSTGKTYDNLNTNSFAHDAFSAREYAAIADTTHIAGGDYTGKNEGSTDRLFLLSKEEATSGDYGLGTNNDEIVASTALAANVKMYNNSDVSATGAAYWWLRSPGNYDVKYDVRRDGNACAVANSGGVYNFLNVNYVKGAVRAAFNLNQESVLFLSAAVGGKTSVAVGNGFKLADYTGADGWKVTLKDAYDETENHNGIKAPTDVTVAQHTDGKGVNALAETTPKGGVIDLTNGVYENYGVLVVTYTAQAITDSKANCVSAIVKDSAGNYVNYAKISSEDKETAKKVPFGDLADGRYRMYIFAEAASGDKQTDYASAFSNGDGYEFIKDSGETVKKGILSAAYKDKNLTIKLGGDFDLSFENDIYATKIIVEGSDNNKLTGGVNEAKPAGFVAALSNIFDTKLAEEQDFTTLKELVTVKENTKLAAFKKIKFLNLELNGDLKVEDGAVVELHETTIGDGITISVQDTGTLINQSGEDITVQHVKEDGTTEEVTVKSGYSYKPSAGDPQPVTPEPTESKGGGSSVGCNAGFGIAMLLSAAAAMLCKRKRG